MFQKYQRIGTIEARPYEFDDQAHHVISISEADMKLPTLMGGMVARNPDNPDDMWYIAADFFAKHYAPLVTPANPSGCICLCPWNTDPGPHHSIRCPRRTVETSPDHAVFGQCGHWRPLNKPCPVCEPIQK